MQWPPNHLPEIPPSKVVWDRGTAPTPAPNTAGNWISLVTGQMLNPALPGSLHKRPFSWGDSGVDPDLVLTLEPAGNTSLSMSDELSEVLSLPSKGDESGRMGGGW